MLHRTRRFKGPDIKIKGTELFLLMAPMCGYTAHMCK